MPFGGEWIGCNDVQFFFQGVYLLIHLLITKFVGIHSMLYNSLRSSLNRYDNGFMVFTHILFHAGNILGSSDLILLQILEKALSFKFGGSSKFFAALELSLDKLEGLSRGIDILLGCFGAKSA